MKKVVIVLAVLLVVGVFSGCDNGTTTEAKEYITIDGAQVEIHRIGPNDDAYKLGENFGRQGYVNIIHQGPYPTDSANYNVVYQAAQQGPFWCYLYGYACIFEMSQGTLQALILSK